VVNDGTEDVSISKKKGKRSKPKTVSIDEFHHGLSQLQSSQSSLYIYEQSNSIKLVVLLLLHWNIN